MATNTTVVRNGNPNNNIPDQVPQLKKQQKTENKDVYDLGRSQLATAIGLALKKLDSLHILPDERLVELQEILSKLKNPKKKDHQISLFEQAKKLAYALGCDSIITEADYQVLYKKLSTDRSMNSIQEAHLLVGKIIEEKTGQLKKITDTLNAAFNAKDGLIETTTTNLIKSVGEALTAVPEESLDTLKRSLNHLHNLIVEQKEISAEYRQTVANQLEVVTIGAKQILRERGTEDQLQILNTFLANLQGPNPIDSQALTAVIKIVHTHWKDQQGAVGKIIDNIFVSFQRIGHDHLNGLSEGRTKKTESASNALLEGVTIEEVIPQGLDNNLKAEKEILLTNAYKTITVMTLESVCGMTLSPEEKKSLTESDTFEITLFAKIDEKSQIPAWMAKLCAYLLKPILGFYVYKTIENGFQFVDSKLEQARQNRLKPVIDMGVTYFSSINKAFQTVAKGQKIGSVMDLMGEELLGKEHNGNMTPAELYAAVTSKIVDEFAPKWDTSGTINRFLESLRIDNASAAAFLNVPIITLTKPIEFMVWAFLLLPQFIVNTVVTAIVKKVLISRNDIGNLIEGQSTGADQSEMEKQLENLKFELLELGVKKMQRVLLKLKGKEQEIEAAAKKLDVSTSKLIRALVANGLEALDNHKNETVWDLHKHFETSESSRIMKKLQDLGFGLVQDELVKEFAAITDELLNQQNMNLTLLQGLRIVNEQLFTTQGKQYTEEQKGQIQGELQSMSTQLGESTVNQAFLGGAAKTEFRAKAFVKTLKEKTAAFIQKMQQFKHDGKYAEMEALWSQFKLERLHALKQEKGFSESGPVFQNFDDLSLELAKLLNALGNSMSAQNEHLDNQLTAIETWAAQVKEIVVDHSKLDVKKMIKGFIDAIDPNLTNQISQMQSEELKKFLALPYNKRALMHNLMLAFIRA